MTHPGRRSRKKGLLYGIAVAILLYLRTHAMAGSEGHTPSIKMRIQSSVSVQVDEPGGPTP